MVSNRVLGALTRGPYLRMFTARPATAAGTGASVETVRPAAGEAPTRDAPLEKIGEDSTSFPKCPRQGSNLRHAV
jgi:hypothetical protein